MSAFLYALRFGRSLRLVILVFLAAASGTITFAESPPEVPLSGGLRAPVYEVPENVGTVTYQGVLIPAGDYLVEVDTYDAAASTRAASFTVRRAADRVALHRLAAGAAMGGIADGVAFADGTQFALRVRDTADGLARIHVHNLADGARRLVLSQPKPRADDDFGRSVWFTENRVLVAAPGRDFIQRNAGAIYVFDRATGRFIGVVGTGIKNSFFGSEPLSPDEAGPQPEGVPYVQVSGKRALIVHGRRAFRFSGDRLSPLTLAPDGLNRAILKEALITENRIILTTTESRNGRIRPGRVLAYDLATGKLRYQLRAKALGGSYEFPSRIVADGPRLYVHDSAAELPDTENYGALQVFDIANGRRLGGMVFPRLTTQSSDSRSLALSGGLLWLRFYEARDGQSSITIWSAYDPHTLTESFRLTPPGKDRFVGRAPQPVGQGRFAVVATRTVNSWPDWSDLFASGTSASRSSSAIINIGNSFTTAGVLLFDRASATWTHRLLLEGDLGFIHSNVPLPHENLRITAASSGRVISVHPAASFFEEIVDYDPTLPEPVPEIEFEGRLSFTLQTGYAYELLKRAPVEENFALARSLGLGDGEAHDESVPYADFLAGSAYRLDGHQFSRRLSTTLEPVRLGTNNDKALHLAAFGDRLAVDVGPGDFGPVTPPSVRLFDLATHEPLLTIPDSGPVALNANYLAVGNAPDDYPGRIKVYDATTGSHLATINGDKRFGAAFGLAGDRLVATSVSSTYESGIYTHTAQVSVYTLPAGRLEYTRTLATITNSLSWSHPPCDLVVAGDHIVVRSATPDANFADAGRVRVLDLATGDTRYELASPASEPGDYFGAWLAADGDWLAVGSSGTSEVFVHDLSTGALRHTLVLSDRPEGIVNYAVSIPRLAIDAATARLSWFVSDNREPGLFGYHGVAYVFNLLTGLEEAKVLPPPPAENSAQPALTGVIFAGDHLVATTQSTSLLFYPLTEALATPLLETSLALTPIPGVRLAFPTRRGIKYRPEVSADAGVTWSSLGPEHYGDGQTAVLRHALAASPAPETLRFRLTTSWATAPYFSITITQAPISLISLK